MGQQDKVEKYLEDYNDVFADISNVLLFEGKEVIKPDELRPSKARTQYKADDEELHEQERDVAKYWKKGNTTIAICGIENQTNVDQDMPFRVIGYDGASYREQLLDKECNKRYPVVTMVLYFGMKHWWKPKSLKEAMKIPKELQEYVNDYKVHVFEIAWLTDEQVNMFQSDFQIVADYFTQKRKNKNYQPSKKVIKHVDAVLKLSSVFANDKRFGEVFISEQQKEVKSVNMCEMLDRYLKNGIEQATKDAVENATNNVAKNMLDANEPIEKIVQYTGLSKEEVCQLKKEESN